MIGEHVIKTAGHCLKNSSVKKINCIGVESVTYQDHQVYPNYNQTSLEAAVENRYQDQALIRVAEELSSISFIPLTDPSSINLSTFSQCLMAGFGRQEVSLAKTGFLSASIIPNHAEIINISTGITNVMGAYFVELLPGDSGGPLLCYKNGTWFDLGTASAHSWEHESIYSTNSNLKFSSLNFSNQSVSVRRPVTKQRRSTAKSPRFLAPYSTVRTLAGEVLFNGDLEFVMLSMIQEFDEKHIQALLKVNSASNNFLCFGPFLCYGDRFEVIINKNDLLDNRYHHPPAYDPFK